jgi:hypothetical protein
MVWQVFGLGVLMVTSVYFCWEFADYELSLRHVSLLGHHYHWSDMLGVILFNFSLVLAIPAWLHEKKDDVSVNGVVNGSTFIATSLYIAVGAMGALALPNVNVNMLSPMVSGAFGPGMQFSCSIFAFFIIRLDILLFSVLTRYSRTLECAATALQTCSWSGFLGPCHGAFIKATPLRICWTGGEFC